MRRIKCTIAYDGTHFAGYQIQQQKRTVQGELEHALSIIHKGQFVRVYASGRTDATVHAYGQVIHFDTPLAIPDEKWPKALNALLPDDVIVKEASEVPLSFHARFGVKKGIPLSCMDWRAECVLASLCVLLSVSTKYNSNE
ncbi:tRNA pseudouridine synthase A [Anoxybacillus sp. BCO1]|nr:tRNA pseudouridine synthase A [Anoxybacillus sp. BCO1]